MKLQIHPNFKLNSNKFTSISELLDFCESDFPDAFEFLNDWFSKSKYIIVPTSGSTGNPKLIKIKKEFMINSAVATATYFELQEENVTALLCLSPKYIAGKMMLVRALISGWKLDVIAPCSDPLKTNKKYDVTALVPLQVHHSLKDLHKVKLVLVGGGKVSKSLQSKLQNIKTKIFATYGMTETITHIAVKKINHLNGITNYFKVLPNVRIEKDARNCLVIDAPSISDKKVITNDIIKLIDDKHFCWIGRFDNIINTGGVKINPERVEEKLSDSISQRFFIASQQDEVLGNKVILIIESKENFKLDESIIDFLDKFEKPKNIYYIVKFIETKTNKINRKATLALINIST